MSQRDSGYERKERDSYETPAWVTEVIVKYINGNRCVWEPAAGSGKMAEVLRRHGMEVSATDITTGDDFLAAQALLACRLLSRCSIAGGASHSRQLKWIGAKNRRTR
jgi:hypothetical protein